MLKPNDYRQTYVVTQDLPYSMVQLPGNPRNDGLLCTGRVVYLQTACSPTDADLQVSAYAEGLGLVRICSRWLSRVH